MGSESGAVVGVNEQRVQLQFGKEAEHMGDGSFIVIDTDEFGRVHNVFLSAEDLAKLIGFKL